MASGSGLFCRNIYVIYIDRMGTGSLIREKDSIYENRIGFYEMAPLYLDSYEVFRSIFGASFKFFGFSDTVVAAPQTNDSREVASAACMAFERLLGYSIASRIYITRGDLGFHRFEELGEGTENFVCPIYGSTILDAHEMEEWGIRCLGVFAHPSTVGDFVVAKAARFADGSPAGLLNLPSYLSSERMAALINTLRDLRTLHDVDAAVSRVQEHPSIRASIDSMKKLGIPAEEIEDSLREPWLRRNKDARATMAYCTALLDAISGETVVLQRHEGKGKGAGMVS